MTKLTLKNFDAGIKKVDSDVKNFVKVGLSTCGIAAGAQDVFQIFKKELEKKESDLPVLRCGCAGMCYAEPLVEVKVEGMPTVVYGKVNPEIALKIVRKHILGKQILNDCIFSVKDE